MADDLPGPQRPQASASPAPPGRAQQHRQRPPEAQPQPRAGLDQEDAVPLTIDEDLKVREPTSFSLRELLTKEEN